MKWKSIFLVVVLGASLNLQAQVQFPLRVSPSGRYLVDQGGTPFLYLADTGWLLFSNLTKAEAEQYLENRRQKGFTAIQAQLIGHAPAGAVTKEGKHPAFANFDLTKPNEAYFDHAEWVLQKAADKGLLVVLSTAWFGYRQSGWFKHLTNQSARPYARFLAQRFKKFQNIIWIHAGDWKPAERYAAINTMANVLDKEAPHQLQTVHNGWNGLSTDDFADQKWLDINMSVAVDQVETYTPVLSAYNIEHPRILPVIMGEPPYERERTNANGLRSRAYWTMLSGGGGYAYGVIPIWNFDVGWQKVLEAEGSLHMTHLKNLLQSRKWCDLVPDQDHAAVSGGSGPKGTTGYVTAARTNDGRLVLAYLPKSNTVTVDLKRMPGPIKAQWYDPTNGTYKPVAGSPFTNKEAHSFVPAAYNAAGDEDWVLVLETAEN